MANGAVRNRSALCVAPTRFRVAPHPTSLDLRSSQPRARTPRRTGPRPKFRVDRRGRIDRKALVQRVRHPRFDADWPAAKTSRGQTGSSEWRRLSRGWASSPERDPGAMERLARHAVSTVRSRDHDRALRRTRHPRSRPSEPLHRRRPDASDPGRRRNRRGYADGRRHDLPAEAASHGQHGCHWWSAVDPTSRRRQQRRCARRTSLDCPGCWGVGWHRTAPSWCHEASARPRFT